VLALCETRLACINVPLGSFNKYLKLIKIKFFFFKDQSVQSDKCWQGRIYAAGKDGKGDRRKSRKAESGRIL
jgi:hypothetical protein